MYKDLYKATQLGNKLAVNLFFEDNIDKKINFYSYCAHDLFRNYFEKNEIDFFDYDFPLSILGTTVKDKDGTTIAVRKNLLANRKNFTIAHEIGHIEMHLENEDEMYFDTGSIIKETENITGLEREANAFAAGLLIPTSALLMNLFNTNTAYQSAERLKVSKDVLYWRLVNYVHEEINYHSYVKKIISDYFDCKNSSEVANSDLLGLIEAVGAKVSYTI